ncbi:type 1 glutamine amidotransferase, partial [bacterium]|nr:type 1 glutamine amidotransferase [bacterium]
AEIGAWARKRSHELTCTRLCAGEPPPPLAAFDLLLIMGGAMNIHEHEKHPWLVEEKALIRRAIDSNKALLGICLGAQLLADVLGGTVTRNLHKEIGWHPIRLAEEALDHPFLTGWPRELTVFHWHGDTFSPPPHSVSIGSSAACANQGFIYDDRVVGLQFHLEYQTQSIEAMLENCKNELVPGPWIQSPEEIRAGCARIPELHGLLYSMLEGLEDRVAGLD